MPPTAAAAQTAPPSHVPAIHAPSVPSTQSGRFAAVLGALAIPVAASANVGPRPTGKSSPPPTTVPVATVPIPNIPVGVAPIATTPVAGAVKLAPATPSKAVNAAKPGAPKIAARRSPPPIAPAATPPQASAPLPATRATADAPDEAAIAGNDPIRPTILASSPVATATTAPAPAVAVKPGAAVAADPPPGPPRPTATAPTPATSAVPMLLGVAPTPDAPTIAPLSAATSPATHAPHAVAPAVATAAGAVAAQIEQPVRLALTATLGAAGQRVTVLLHPAELGRIDVQVARDPAGHVQVTLTADRPETAARLAADQPALHAALDRAGVAPERIVTVQAAATPEPATDFSTNSGAGGQGTPNPRPHPPSGGGPGPAEPPPIGPQAIATSTTRSLGLDITA